jgi:polysaccharide biosynthesis protein PslG
MRRRTAVVTAVVVAAVAAGGVAWFASSRSSGRSATPPGPVLPVGVATHPWVLDAPDSAQAWQAVRNLRTRVVRVDASWATVEPSPGSFDWSGLDAVVRTADRDHVRLIFAVHATPSWANGGLGPTAPPTQVAAFAAFARALASRYRGHHLVYEIWNEENAPFGWGGPAQPARYAALLEAASTAIRATDRTATVLVGGFAQSKKPGVIRAVQFLHDLYALGAGKAFDGVAYHPYARGSAVAPGAALVRQVPLLRAVMVRAGDAHKDIWVTEFGYPITPARGAVKVAALERSAIAYTAAHYPYVAVFVVYELVDEGRGGTFGLYTRSWDPRPSARMLASVLSPTGTVPRTSTTP